MSELLPFIVSGLAIGAVYGLAGSGLVLTYKTSGIFNFGHGALATVAAYLFYWLHVTHGLSPAIAAALTIGVGGPLTGLAMELVARRLSTRPTAMKIVGTVGLILLVQGLGTLAYGPDPINVDDFLPHGEDVLPLGSVNVQYKFIIVTAVALAVMVALYALFRFSRVGVTMRAVVDDPDLVSLTGTSPATVRRTAWIVGATLAALSGVLVLPLVGLEPIALTFLVVEAFGAAAAGAFSSLPLTFAGGLAIGVAADLSKNYVLEVGWLSGLPSSLPFVALVLVLLVLPRRKLLPVSRTEVPPRAQWRAPGRVRAMTAVVVGVPFLLVPAFAGANLPFYTSGLTQVILLLSLGLLVRTSGQVSLCHSTFAAIGAVAFSQFAVGLHLPWLVALLLGGLVAIPVGALVAVPAIRLSGLFLALATLGFAVMVERLAYPLDFMFTPLAEGRPMPRPSFAAGDISYYYLVLAFVVAVALLMVAIHRGRLGRLLRGMSESPVAVSTAGLSTQVTKVVVFCLSAFLAAVAGILYGTTLHTAATTDTHYSSFFSVVLLASLAIAPFAEPWYAIFMGMTAVIPAYLPGATTGVVMNALFGLFAIQVAMAGGTSPLPQRWRAALDRRGGTRPARRPTVDPPLESTRVRGDGLRVADLTVRFGGLVAVNDLRLHAPMGRITGLIGPNGAGKTTTFDVCSGMTRQTTGQVLFHGRDVSRAGPATRGRAGIGRTFQIMQLCESLTVAENVALGRESGLAGASVLAHLTSSFTQRQVTDAAARSALEVCGLTDLADMPAAALSTGQRRLVELARCLAGPFDLLLLDEPSSGLDRAETEAFGDVLERIVRERGIGILLVEHDMSLVMRVCDYIYVLDFGELLFEGDPARVRSSEAVRNAYLGTSGDLEEAAS